MAMARCDDHRPEAVEPEVRELCPAGRLSADGGDLRRGRLRQPGPALAEPGRADGVHRGPAGVPGCRRREDQGRGRPVSELRRSQPSGDAPGRGCAPGSRDDSAATASPSWRSCAAQPVDLVDQRHHHRRGVGVEVEVARRVPRAAATRARSASAKASRPSRSAGATQSAATKARSRVDGQAAHARRPPRSRNRSGSWHHPLARIVGVALPPAPEERLQLAVDAGRRDDLQRDELVAAACRRASRPCRAGAAPVRCDAPFGMVSATRPSMVGTSTLPPSTASSRLIGSSTRMSSPSRRKKGCGSTVDRHQRVAGRAAADPVAALAAQPDRLAIGEPLRDLHVEHAAVGQGDPPGGAARRLEEADLERVVPIGAAHPDALAARAAARRAGRTGRRIRRR